MKTRVTSFTPAFSKIAHAQLVALLRADTAKARRLAEDIAAWQVATAPRLVQADPAFGFDLALVRGVPTTAPGGPQVGTLTGLARRADGVVVAVSLPGADLSPAAETLLARRLGDTARRVVSEPLVRGEAALTLPRLEWADHRTRPERSNPWTCEPPSQGMVVQDWRKTVLTAAQGMLERTLCLPHAVTLRHEPAHEHYENVDYLQAFQMNGKLGWALVRIPPGDPGSEALRLLDGRTIEAGRPFTLPDGLRVDASVVQRIAEAVLRDALEAADTAALARANRAFLARLDRGLLSAMAETGNAHRGVALHNWLHASDDARRATLRRQALEAYPLLLGSPRRPAVLDEVIDGAVALEERLAAACDIPVPAVRALQGVRADAVKAAGADPDELIETLPKLRGLPPGHWPARADKAPPLAIQWAGLTLAHRAFGQLSAFNQWEEPILPGTASAALANEKPFWRVEGGLDQALDCRIKAVLVRDTIDAFTAAVLMPLAIDVMRAAGEEPQWERMVKLVYSSGAAGESAVSRAFVRDRPLGRLVALSDLHHDNHERINASIVACTDPRDWPPLSEAWSYQDGVSALEVVPLTTSAQLASEGAAQGHCVASYVTHCMYQRCHILSIRRPGGAVLSTAEICLGEPDLDGFEPELTVRQHQGPKNGAPPAEAAAALDSYLAAIAEGVLLPDWTALEVALQERIASRPTAASGLAEMIGYDPDDAQARDAVFEAWGFVLPRDERGLGHAAWAARLGLPDLLHERLADLPTAPSRRMFA